MQDLPRAYSEPPYSTNRSPDDAYPPLRPYQGWGEAAYRYIQGDAAARNALGGLALKAGQTARTFALKGTPVLEIGFAIFPGFVDDIVNLGIWTAAVRGVVAQRNRMKAERGQK